MIRPGEGSFPLAEKARDYYRVKGQQSYVAGIVVWARVEGVPQLQCENAMPIKAASNRRAKSTASHNRGYELGSPSKWTIRAENDVA
jgi:hypothetical protein